MTQNPNSRLCRYKMRLKLKVLVRLGNICACCGEANPMFLTVDHIHNDGVQHRKGFRGSRAVTQVYQDVLQDSRAETTYQLLCMNCNSAKQWYGACPHQTMLDAERAQVTMRDFSAYRYKVPATVTKDALGRWTSYRATLTDGGYS